MKSMWKKIILIVIAFLMLFSLVGQFMVSAQALDDSENIIEETDINEEKIDEDIIIQEDNLDVVETEVAEDLKPSNDEDFEEDLEEDLEEAIEIEEENIEEMDGQAQVEPYNAFANEEINSIQTFSAGQAVNNPKITDDRYQVVRIENNGNITVQGYHKSYKAAHAAMSKYTNGAIRHKNSNSPMKFIAATRGILHSVPHRDAGKATMYINDAFGSGTSTYVSRGYEMAYFGTTEYNPNTGIGTVHLGINGFYGTTNLKLVDVIPMTYVENSITISLGGSDETDSSSLKTPRVNSAPAQSYYLFKTSPVNHGKTAYYYSENLNREINNPTKVYWKHAGAFGIAEEPWIKDNVKYYSWDGVNFYTDRDFKNYAGSYYNYYQYLPLRSKSMLEPKHFDAFLETKVASSNKSLMRNSGKDFIDLGEQYGMNPLLVYSMGSHESSFGTSRIAVNKNNLFGWNAYDSNPGDATDYKNVNHAVKEHMGRNLRSYLDVTYERGAYKKDFRYNGGHLGNRGSGFNLKYASDPFWGMKIARIAYEIDASAGLVDYNKHKLGLVLDGYEYVARNEDITNTSQKTNALLGDVYYNFKNSNNYMGKVTTILNEDSKNNKFYKTQSFTAIGDNKEIISYGTGTALFDYNWENSVGFIKKDKVVQLYSNDKYFNTDKGIKPKPVLKNDIDLVVKPDTKPKNVIERFAGNDRIDTALKVSATAYDKGSDAVIITGYLGEVDALTGTLLAANKKAPVLMTRPNDLTTETEQEIKRLKSKTIYILGGEAAVSKNVEKSLNNISGVLDVVRISGKNRFDTAAAVAKAVKPDGINNAFIVRGLDNRSDASLADALAIGPVSANNQEPVLLVEQNKLRAETKKALKELNVKSVTIVGGTGAISQAVENEIKDLNIAVKRIYGDSRESTALKIADTYFKDSNTVLVANGRKSADALIGGYFGYIKNAPILLTNPAGLTDANKMYLTKDIELAYILGGNAVITDETYNQIKYALNID